MILSAIAERLKRRSKDDFKGRHFKASLILQAVSWYLRYPLSYRDIEELFLERGLAVNHSTLNPQGPSNLGQCHINFAEGCHL
jgi:transposase, IS6 family